MLLNYVDRGAVGIAAPKLKDELMLSATAFGIAVSAFSWIYAPAQFAVGWLSDRFCVYRLIGAGLVVWALATFLTGFANGLVMLVASAFDARVSAKAWLSHRRRRSSPVM